MRESERGRGGGVRACAIRDVECVFLCAIVSIVLRSICSTTLDGSIGTVGAAYTNMPDDPTLAMFFNIFFTLRRMRKNKSLCSPHLHVFRHTRRASISLNKLPFSTQR